MAKVSKTFQSSKYMSRWRNWQTHRTVQELCIGLNTLTATKSDLKSGALVGILVQVQGGSPGAKKYRLAPVEAIAASRYDYILLAPPPPLPKEFYRTRLQRKSSRNVLSLQFAVQVPRMFSQCVGKCLSDLSSTRDEHRPVGSQS